MIDLLLQRFQVERDVAEAAKAAYGRVSELPPRAADAVVRLKVLSAFRDEGLAESDLWGSLGYGYDDAARARYESLIARVLEADSALARFSLVSGTHAIVAALAACAAPGERIVCATGRPYDTLRNALVEAPGSLLERGVRYAEVPLRDDGRPDLAAIERACAEGCAALFVQRSRGYAPRPSLSVDDCRDIVQVARQVAGGIRVIVDNCYGELVEEREPTAFGADLLAGSLIKNLGGGIAPGGGYVAGAASLIEQVASHHYAPGLRAGVGPTFGLGRLLIQGLFLAPTVISEALAGLDFVAALFEEVGYDVDPKPGRRRVDTVQSIALGDARRLTLFARGLQHAMPVNARFVPEPGAVPGYAEPVIMSSGAFVAGSTSELSCDAPMRPPFAVYVQGGTMREHTMLGAILAADALARARLLYRDRDGASGGVAERRA